MPVRPNSLLLPFAALLVVACQGESQPTSTNGMGDDELAGDVSGGDPLPGDFFEGDPTPGDMAVGDPTPGDIDTVIGPRPCNETSECQGQQSCIGYGCVEPVPDLDAYASEAAARPASYVHQIQIPSMFDQPERCCFDYTGDGTPDNGMGPMLSLGSAIGDDPQAVLDDAVASGRTVAVVDWRGLPDDLQAGGRTWAFLFSGQLNGDGSGTGATLEQRRAGVGHVLLRPESFGTHGARYQLNDGTITGGQLTARGNGFELPLLVSGVLLQLELTDLRMSGSLERDGTSCLGVCSVDEERDGVSVGGVKLGGVITADELFSELDTVYRTCTCAGIDPSQPVITWTANQEAGVMEFSCTENYSSDVTGCETDSPCASLPNACSLVSIWGNILDVDGDNDGINDAISAGFRLGLSGTAIDGIACSGEGCDCNGQTCTAEQICGDTGDGTLGCL